MIQRGFCSKCLSILLILALLIGMGGVNSFAMEGDELPTVTEDEVEIIVEDTIISDGAENDNLEVESEIGSEEENKEGIVNLAVPQSNGVLLEGNIVQVATAIELEDALKYIKDFAQKEWTIQLLNDIKYTQVISINNKDITFDLGSNTLDVETTDYGLRVEEGHVKIQGNGELNVTGDNYGVRASKATVEVTNATANKNGYGALAESGSIILIKGNAISNNVGGSYSGYGARANDNSEIEVEGDVKGGQGAYAFSGSEITIRGSATAVDLSSDSASVVADTNSTVILDGETLGNCYGARCINGGNITIEGKINQTSYIKLGNVNKHKIDKDNESTMVGYHAYSDNKNIVWVKATGDEPIAPIAKIGTKEYTTLDEALIDVKTGETIELLKNTNYDKGIKIDGIEITFDVGSHTLNVVNQSGAGLEVINGGEVLLEGTGQFNVTGADYGVYVDSVTNKESSAMVTNAMATSDGDNCYGAYAYKYGSEIIVLGNAKASGVNSVGVGAYQNATITVEGNSEGDKHGLVAENYGTVTVKGDVKSTGRESIALLAKINGKVTVKQDVLASGEGSIGGRVISGSIVEVVGNVDGVKYGVDIGDSGGISTITVGKDVIATGENSTGILAINNATVFIKGNVLATGNGSIGAQIYGSGEIKVTGNVQGQRLGAGASGGSIVIGGDAIGFDSRDSTGALTESKGEIIINGNATGGSYGVIARSGNITIKKDAKGINYGVYAIGDTSIVTVHGSAIATENDGAYAYHKAKIFINGDAICENPGGGYSGYGARADSFSTIKVEGDVKGLGGALADGNSEITIGGNAISTANTVSDVASVYALNNSSVILSGNTSGGQYGAKSLQGGNITIDGVINQTMYINLNGEHKNIGGHEEITTKPGYYTYKEEHNELSSYVWVKIPVEDTELPTWPGDSTITGFPTATTLPLKWPKARDNVGVDKYLIYTVTYSGEDGDPGTAKLIAEVSHNNDIDHNQEFELINLDPETKYRIRITAVDKSGNINEGSLEREFTTKKAFTVTFDSQGGTLVNNQIITEGEKATNPNTNRLGFTFSGWFKDIECLNPWNFDTDTITGNITLYAKWIEGEINPPTTPTITTNLPTSKSVTKGNIVTLTVNANVNDGGILSYQWYKDGIAIVGANENFITITNTSTNDSGSYKVIISNTKDGTSSLVESTTCALKINSSSGGGDDDDDHTPVDRDKKKDRDTKNPEEIYYGIIILGIDEEILDENTLVPYFINNRDDIIVKLSAVIDGDMHLIGNSDTKYRLKDNIKYYTDIANHWGKNDINFVTAREFFLGVGNDEFGPDTPITRAMVVTTLGKLWGIDISLYKTSRFIDVKIDEPYAPYVEWAAENNIVNGIGNNYFGPEKPITREEIAVIITRFIKYTNLDINEDDVIFPLFTDYNTISEWAKESIRSLQNAKIISGKLDNIFDPQGMTTRAETAVILKRLIINIVK